VIVEITEYGLAPKHFMAVQSSPVPLFGGRIFSPAIIGIRM